MEGSRMSIHWHGVPNAMLNAALLLLGLVLAAVPLALWLVWSEPLFYGVIAVFGLALPLYLVLSRFEEPGNSTRPAPPPQIGPELVDEMQRLMPLIHHHHRRGTARFNRAMARLRRQRPDGA
jgi:hypothetical protein